MEEGGNTLDRYLNHMEGTRANEKVDEAGVEELRELEAQLEKSLSSIRQRKARLFLFFSSCIAYCSTDVCSCCFVIMCIIRRSVDDAEQQKKLMDQIQELRDKEQKLSKENEVLRGQWKALRPALLELNAAAAAGEEAAEDNGRVRVEEVETDLAIGIGRSRPVRSLEG
ncbi:hypothetical protein U9M48_026007 [Paspalum notatum var. saurae]|uniref:K-box domain-containing protein n=1 Tax=Paspalum notatum var. saurae TaxID=547442 RepID=A0AAQ3WYX7_PASNO